MTPAGSRTLRLQIDCGDDGDHLILQVVMAGDDTAELARSLRVGQRVRATGTLRTLLSDRVYRAKLSLEVVANSITRDPANSDR